MQRALGALMLMSALPQVAVAQTPVQALTSEIAISRDRAEIKLELEDGRTVTLATAASSQGERGVRQTGSPGGDQIVTMLVTRGDRTDRSWRELLGRAMDTEPEELPALLSGWTLAGSASGPFEEAIDAALAGTGGVHVAAPPAPGVIDDSVIKLESKIQQLEEELQARERAREERRDRGFFSPLRHVWRGISGIVALLVTYAVLFGIGFIAILFGARKYLEGVSDTIRSNMGRSFVVGLAGTFLLLPVFVLGAIALVISIVGIPALLVWVPLFPIGAMVACVLGYLGVAHAAGESYAERNYYGSEWFRRSNSYYFLITGLALLSALFFAANVITMAGPWLGFINGVLNFFGVLVTWLSVTIGFGAVLSSRGGSRSANPLDAAQSSLFTDEANV